jgi:hypothetical protein
MPRQPRNPVLDRLDALVGEWTQEAVVDGEVVGTGRARFEWTEDRAFLVQHAEGDPPLPGTPQRFIENSPLPVVTMIGLDDTSERFSLLYADARNVVRVYQMTLADGVWEVWRDAPGFFQRFRGTFEDGGRFIRGRWEGSPDGTNWRTDFDQNYRRIG